MDSKTGTNGFWGISSQGKEFLEQALLPMLMKMMWLSTLAKQLRLPSQYSQLQELKPVLHSGLRIISTPSLISLEIMDIKKAMDLYLWRGQCFKLSWVLCHITIGMLQSLAQYRIFTQSQEHTTWINPSSWRITTKIILIWVNLLLLIQITRWFT